MVEGRDQLNLLRQQHAIAEHVARHVADARDGEGRALDVGAQLAEMALHRFPRATRGDAHLLVVVSGRAARGEGIVEPEAVVARQRIGDVGKGGGAFICGDNEIGIVAVAPHHLFRRHDGTGHVVVGDVEHAADQGLVAGDALGLDLLARAVHRRLLHVEAALGADRNDHRVLHHLRLHQRQNLGAEILAPVRPADAAARHASTAQVDAFHARAVDEDLDQRTWRRQVVDGAAIDLEGDPLLLLPVIGAQGAGHGIQEPAQDTVFVERGDLLEVGREIDWRCPARRIEPFVEGVDQAARYCRIGDQRALHVFLAERQAGLAQILRIGAEHGDLAPGEAGAQHEFVQPIVLQFVRPELVERFGEARTDVGEIDGRTVGRLDGQHLQRHALPACGAGKRERRLAQYAQPEIFCRRQDVGQHDRRLGMEQPQGEAVKRLVGVTLEAHAERFVTKCRLQKIDVAHRAIGGEFFAIGRGKIAAPFTGGGATFDFAHLRFESGPHPVVP